MYSQDLAIRNAQDWLPEEFYRLNDIAFKSKGYGALAKIIENCDAGEVSEMQPIECVDSHETTVNESPFLLIFAKADY